ncbi:MAG: amidohydrolase family protein [Acidimicrobiales bacterium]|nr:amidohydrolase family protein [Acidimicrobiales bacterium]
MSRLLVKGGTVVDGSGAPGRRADVLVVGDRIAEIGVGLSASGAQVVDASGALVAPGFIDTHTHLDPSLFWDGGADPMPQHGVTTVLTGNCSLSLVPVRPETVASVSEVFCFIEDMPPAVFAAGIPWSWERFDSYRDALDSNGLAVHVAALIGHSVLRMYVMGEEAWERSATDAERLSIAQVLDECLAAGAFGLSSSRIDVDARRRPVPSRLADDAEFDSLFEVLGARRGMVGFIPNFLSGNPIQELDELGNRCARHGVAGLWNGLTHSPQDPQRSAALVDLARRQQESGIELWPMMSPRTIDFRIGWSGSAVFLGMGETWHTIPSTSDPGERRARLADAEWREHARREWDAATIQLFPTRSIDRVRFFEVTKPEHERWLGCTLADLAAERGGHPSDVLADWVLDNDLRPGIVVVGVANADVDGVAGLLVDPATLISASDAGAHVQMMCAAGDSTLLLTRHVRDRGDLTVERAVHELTDRQARVCGITDRGRIEEGLVADITVFALDELDWSDDEFVNDLPTGAGRLRRPPGGYRATIAAGTLTQEHGELTGSRPARVLRHTS